MKNVAVATHIVHVAVASCLLFHDLYPVSQGLLNQKCAYILCGGSLAVSMGFGKASISPFPLFPSY